MGMYGGGDYIGYLIIQGGGLKENKKRNLY